MTRRTMGEASAEAEYAIEAVIRAVPDWANRAITYAPVYGGISNANWRVAVDGAPHDYFVKIPGRGTELFIDRNAAADASRHAADAGCGPTVIAFLAETGVEISEFVDGRRTSTNGDFMRPMVRRNAARSLRRFNDAPPLRLTKTLFDMIDEHLRQATTLGAYVPPDQPWLLREYRRARAALEASGLDLVPCMNDTLAGNFLLDAHDDVLLVDFEYASNNDRVCELAVWFGEMFFSRDIEREVLEVYFGRVDPAIEARVMVYKALGDLKWSTWAMVQQQVSALDFDYHKYGAWKHMRARTVMHHPDWDLWLRML